MRVSWLLSAICVNGSYEKEKGLTGSLRVLWFKLWSMGEESETDRASKETADKRAAKSGRKSGNSEGNKCRKVKDRTAKDRTAKGGVKGANRD